MGYLSVSLYRYVHAHPQLHPHPQSPCSFFASRTTSFSLPNPNSNSKLKLTHTTGGFRFLDLSVGRSAQYASVLSRIKSGSQFLDIGCCFGQDVRRLIFDGAPIANVHGSDLQQPFLDLGYDLFKDHDKLPSSTFIAADVFDASPASALKAFEGKVDIIHAASFFHLFGYQDSATVGRRFIGLLRKQPGGMIFGRQMGNRTAGEYEHLSLIHI